MKHRYTKLFLLWFFILLLAGTISITASRITKKSDVKFAEDQMQIDSGNNTIADRRENNALIPVSVVGAGIVLTIILWRKEIL